MGSNVSRVSSIALVVLVLLGASSRAGPLGTPDGGFVLILDDRAPSLDDEIDVFDSRSETFLNARLRLPTANTSSRLIAAGDTARVLVPRDGALGASWTEIGFADGGWTEAALGVGYDEGVAGPARLEAYWSFDGSADDLTGNDRHGTLMGGATLVDDVPAALGAGESLLLDGIDSFVVVPGYQGVAGTASRTLSAWVKTSGNNMSFLSWGANNGGRKWNFRVQTSNGQAGAIRVEVNGGFIVGNTDIRDGGWHHVAAVFTTDALPNTQDIRLHVDGALDAAFAEDPAPSAIVPRAIDTAANADVRIGVDFANRLLGGSIDDVAIFSEALSDEHVAALAAGAPPTELESSNRIGALVATDVSAELRGVNSSIYLRVPFDVPDVGTFDALRLSMRYDDGFVAYINGQEVARSTAPADPVWSSAASADRDDSLAVIASDFDLTPFVDALVAGRNVLAIHALNASADADAFLVLPELVATTSNEVSDGITDSNTPGIAYSITTSGRLFRIDWLAGLVTEVARLGESLAEDETHTTYESITNMPDRDLLYILRTERGTGNPNGRDFIDTYDLALPAAESYAIAVFVSVNTGTTSITDGPPFPGFFAPDDSVPALYSIATGGAFEVFDTRAPGPPGVPSLGLVVGTGLPPGSNGNLVSISSLPGETEHMFILQNHTGAGDLQLDRLWTYDLDGNIVGGPFILQHTGATSVTDSPRDAFLYTQASGGSVAHVDPAEGQAGVTDFVSRVSGGAQSVTNIMASTDAARFVYIADDRGSQHFDVHDLSYTWAIGSRNGVADFADATPAPETGSDWQDSSLTDGGDLIWQLFTDGRLYHVDPESGDVELFAELEPSELSLDRATYDSITNIPGDSRLFILRTDRPATSKGGGVARDVIDIFDTETFEYMPDVYETIGTGSTSISDGPPFSGEIVDTRGGAGVYVIATGGSFEVLDPNARGAIVQVRSGLVGADGGGSLVSITNLPGDPDHLYVLRDRSGGGGTDRLDVYDLEGGVIFDALALNGTGAKSITDIDGGRLYTNAVGGACNIIEVDFEDVTRSTVHRFNNGTATLQTSVTNFESDDPPKVGDPVFHRGDANDTSRVDLTDGVFILNFLFSGGPVPPCLDAADSDDNGSIVLTDAVYVLNFLFSQGPPPPAPGPSGSPCGEDPTADTGADLGCVDYEGC